MRAGLGYAVAALALAEGADIFLPNLGYPELVRPSVFVIVGLAPFVLVLAWLYQIAPEERKPRLTAAHGPSIAVLPFADMSPDGDQEYFADGIAEELIHALAGISDLRVAARTSTFALKGREEDVREIGRKLDVSTVLEGSVRKSGDRIRVTAQLISVADGFHLFSEVYDRELSDIFEIQDEITGEVMKSLEVALRQGEQPEAQVGTKNLDAYDLYLRGRYYWHRRYAVGLQAALGYFEKAAELDPEYAAPHTGIADTYTVFGMYGFIPVRDAMEKAGQAARRALELEPNLAEAHFSNGLLQLALHADFEASWDEFEAALKAKPGYGEAQAWKGCSLINQGRFEEGLEAISKALPMDPHSAYLMEVTAIAYAWAKRYEEALHYCDEVTALEPDSVLAHYTASFAYDGLGRFDLAAQRLERVLEISGRTPTWLGMLARENLLLGNHELAEQQAAEVEVMCTQGPFPLGHLVNLYAGLDQPELALEWAERAEKEDGGLPAMLIPGMRFFAPVWSHPGFIAKWKELGLDVAPWQESPAPA